MGLRDLIITKEAVRVDDEQSFDVRGLSYVDFSVLAKAHGGQAGKLFTQIKTMAEAGELDDSGLVEMAKKAIQDFPDLIAHGVAAAADDPDGAVIFKKLRLPVQVEAVERIIGLTFASEGELKKLLETVIRGISAVAESVGLLTQKESPGGSGD